VLVLWVVDDDLGYFLRHLSYLYLDGKRISGNPIGLIGHTLETIYTITTIPKKYLENIIQLFDELGVQILEVCDNSFISSVVLTKSKERHHGIGILDIGCDQSTLTLYENDLPVLAKHFPIGGNSFTKDISICMGITVEEAETMKKSYKQSDARHDSKKDERKLGQIIDARIDDVAQVLSRELAKIIESTQIPNGLILTGGGALLAGIKDKLRHKLAMPVVDGKEILRNATEDVLQDTTWTNAYALTFLDSGEQSVFKSIFSPVLSYFKKLFSKIAP
jgi:cell division protein FtsA